MVLLFGGIYASKVVIIEEDTDVEGGVDVKETSTRGEGADKWAFREFFRDKVIGIFLSKSGKSGG